MIQFIQDQINSSEINPEHVKVDGDGSHFQVIVVSDYFENFSRVKRQQEIYSLLSEKITDGSIHALSIKTYTVAEWQQAGKFL